eukprot:347955_1
MMSKKQRKRQISSGCDGQSSKKRRIEKKTDDINDDNDNGYIYVFKNIKIGSTKYPRHRIATYQTMEINKIKYDAVFRIDKSNKINCYLIDELIKSDKSRNFKRFCEIGHNGGTELYQHTKGNTLISDLIKWFNDNSIKYKKCPFNDPNKYPLCYKQYVEKEKNVKNQIYDKCRNRIKILNDDKQISIQTEYISYILITEGNYDDTIKTLDAESYGLFELIWEGQKQRACHDDTVQIGTHVFYRKKARIPYKYKGIVIKKTLLKKRKKRNPIKLKLIIDDKYCQFAADTICNDIDKNDQYQYQDACWRTIKLPKFKAHGQGIYKVQQIK